jgi:hypothetical protein
MRRRELHDASGFKKSKTPFGFLGTGRSGAHSGWFGAVRFKTKPTIKSLFVLVRPGTGQNELSTLSMARNAATSLTLRLGSRPGSSEGIEFTDSCPKTVSGLERLRCYRTRPKADARRALRNGRLRPSFLRCQTDRRSAGPMFLDRETENA